MMLHMISFCGSDWKSFSSPPSSSLIFRNFRLGRLSTVGHRSGGGDDLSGRRIQNVSSLISVAESSRVIQNVAKSVVNQIFSDVSNILLYVEWLNVCWSSWNRLWLANAQSVVSFQEPFNKWMWWGTFLEFFCQKAVTICQHLWAIISKFWDLQARHIPSTKDCVLSPDLCSELASFHEDPNAFLSHDRSKFVLEFRIDEMLRNMVFLLWQLRWLAASLLSYNLFEFSFFSLKEPTKKFFCQFFSGKFKFFHFITWESSVSASFSLPKSPISLIMWKIFNSLMYLFQIKNQNKRPVLLRTDHESRFFASRLSVGKCRRTFTSILWALLVGMCIFDLTYILRYISDRSIFKYFINTKFHWINFCREIRMTFLENILLRVEKIDFAAANLLQPN